MIDVMIRATVLRARQQRTCGVADGGMVVWEWKSQVPVGLPEDDVRLVSDLSPT
jgi:hypothetical protein